MCLRRIRFPPGDSETTKPQPRRIQTPMASIHIPFPEKDGPVAVALSGARITIGRLPFNTVQIIDRTISGFHAELIMEDGHYRLHDRGSTNGTFVNGEPATDFHLREACKISFGTVECDFDPASEAVHAESVPTRGEMHAVRQENAELRGTLAAVREEVTALLAAKPAGEEFMQVVAERETLKTGQLRQDQEIARLKGEVAVLRRDRENLQKAWDATKAELAKVQRPVEAVAVMEVATPSAAVAVPAVAPEPEVPAAPPAPQAPAPVASAPVSVPPPVPLSRPAMPVAKPVVPLSPPTGRPFPAPKPAAPTVKLMPAPMPTAVGQRPPNSSGVRPLPKPMPTVALNAAKAPVPANAVPKPVSGLHPRSSVMPVHAPVGPKGTQRLG